MRRLFRSFERAGLRYLLISGQASVLYGAATFSEDIDIWIEPTTVNARHLLMALAAVRARVYKLTPPLTRRNMMAGHGFHFVVPDGPLPIYLDVMGRPPRVGGFGPALGRARWMAVEGLSIPVVSPQDLVRLKLTQRLSDYEVISTLVRLQVEGDASRGRGRKALLRWAAAHSFRAEDRQKWLRELGEAAPIDECRREIASEVTGYQARDVAYWRIRINELRRFFQGHTLWPVGSPVSTLVTR